MYHHILPGLSSFLSKTIIVSLAVDEYDLIMTLMTRKEEFTIFGIIRCMERFKVR
jgi:hypothetical protein